MRFAPRKIVQILCGLIGILGLFSVYCGIRFAVSAITDREARGLIVIIPMFFALGGIMIAVAYQSIFKYSARVIGNVSKLAGFLIYVLISQATRVRWEAAGNIKDMPVQLAWTILPIILAWISYRLIKFVLLKFTIENKF